MTVASTPGASAALDAMGDSMVGWTEGTASRSRAMSESMLTGL